jgi:tetratricopeptide (TPR) repeat protein
MVGVPPGVVEDLWREPGREAADVLWNRLESWDEEWLLVIDNADDLDLLTCQDTALKDMTGWVRPPVGRGLGVVVTTRDRNGRVWSATQTQIIDVNPLETSAGAAVLLDLVSDGGPHDDAQGLAAALGGLPLGLVLAGSYLAAASEDPFAQACSFAEYQQLLGISPAVLDGTADMHAGDMRDEDSKARETVARTWELSLALLERRGLGAARQLLQILACFAPNAAMPAALISPGTITSAWGEHAPAEATVSDLLRGLHRFGLLNLAKTDVGPEYALHRLVAEVAARPLLEHPPEHAHLWHAAIGMLCTVSPAESRDPAAWPAWQSIAPHWLQLLTRLPLPSADAILGGCLAQSYLRSRGDFTSAQEAGASLTALVDAFDTPGDLCHTVRYHNALTARDVGDLSFAESEMRAVAQFHEAAGEDSSQLAVAARCELGNILGLRGKPSEAEQMLREVLTAQTAIYGPHSREVLLTRHDLAVILRALARYEEATAEIAELCKEFELAFGPEHVDTLASWHEHAIALRDMHDLDAALTVFKRVYRAECAILGEEHPSTLTTRNNMAITLRLQGHTSVADEELRAVLEARTRLLGANHPDTLDARRQLVVVGVGAGTLSYREAEVELRDILSADGAQLAREHHTIVVGLADLGAAQLAQGHERVALETLQTALDASTRAWGYSHPQTLVTRVQLANLFADAGMHEHALAEYRGALTAQRSAVGQFHIESLNIEVRIAACQLRAGMAQEAYESFRDAAARFARRYGPSHPETLVALVGSATAQMLLGHQEEAIELLECVLSQQLIAEGRASERVAETRGNLAVALGRCGRLEEALTHNDEALASVLPSGTTGRTALELRHNRASVLRQMGRFDESETEHRAILEILVEQSGPRSPRVLDTRHGIARLLADAGRWDQAEADYRDVLKLRREILGPIHLATLTTQGCLAALMNDTGRPVEAQRLYERALSSLTKTVGQDHPEAMLTMHNLAWAYQHQGKFRQAEEMFRRAATHRRRALGPAHEDTLATEFELVNCVRRQRRTGEVVASMRANLETATAAYGTASEVALRARHELAAALAETRHFDDAIKEITEARRIAGAVLPQGHRLRRSIAQSYAGIMNSPKS